MEGDRLSLVQGNTRLLSFTKTSSRSATPTLSGTVAYRERIALPPDAVLTVRLLDVSRADAASVTLGETRVETDGRQVPLPFTVRYDGAGPGAQPLRRPRRDHRRVRKCSCGRPIRPIPSSRMARPRPTSRSCCDRSRPTRRARSEAARGAWPRSARPAASCELRRPGAVHAHLWRGRPLQRAGRLQPGRRPVRRRCRRHAEPLGGLSTLAACPDPSASSAFLGVLNGAERYSLDGRPTLTSRPGRRRPRVRVEAGRLPD